MNRVWRSLLILIALAAGLSITKPLWWPSGLSEKWHRAWLSAPEQMTDPRSVILADHERQVRELREEYEQRIAERKSEHARLVDEYEQLKNRRESQ